MSKKKPSKLQHVKTNKTVVKSLLDNMKDGHEYASIIDLAPQNMSIGEEIRRAIYDIEKIRHHPLILYAANIIKPSPLASNSIEYYDDLPFAEMVLSVPENEKDIDILIVTPGGLAQQVSQFVNKTHSRFDNVSFILPYMAMSAGTIWAMSGHEIWMDERAFIGPIDPQIQGKDGKYVPAQAILVLLKKIEEEGQQKIKDGQNPSWSDIQILRNMDAKEIGNAISLSQYSIDLVANYLQEYKFRDWKTHSGNDNIVTVAEKKERADSIAQKLCSHETWRTHSHGISREVAWNELQIHIDHPETIEGFNKSIRRLWALLYYIFDSQPIAKIFISDNYALFKMVPRG